MRGIYLKFGEIQCSKDFLTLIGVQNDIEPDPDAQSVFYERSIALLLRLGSELFSNLFKKYLKLTRVSKS